MPNKHPTTFRHITGDSKSQLYRESLLTIWQRLYERATPNIFLSPEWFSTWLNCIDEEVIFITAESFGVVTGCAALVRKKSKKLLIFDTDEFYLHKTGNPKFDQIWIECNDILMANGQTESLKTGFIDYILALSKRAELIIGVTDAGLQQSTVTQSRLCRAISLSPSYLCKLDDGFIDRDTLLNNFSKNTKSQLRKSFKLAETEASLVLESPKSAEESMRWLEDLAKIHIGQWAHSDDGSGFQNDNFIQFHHTLIMNEFDKGKIQLARLVNATQTIGYLYGYIENKHYYFYLSAIKKDANPKIKYGLMAHVLNMQNLARLGVNRYDFLAGRAQYKASLSDEECLTGIFVISNSDILHRIDLMLRKIKKRLNFK